MKSIQYILFFAVTFFTITACSDDITNTASADKVNRKPIEISVSAEGFKTAESSTRGTLITTDNYNTLIKNFYAWGFTSGGEKQLLGTDASHGELLTNNGGKAEFGSSLGNVYWPDDEDYAEFYAATPADDENISYEGEDDNTILHYKVPTDISKQVDLMVAPTQRVKKGETVNFKFQHALTRLKVKAKADVSKYPDAKGMVVFIKSIKIKNLRSTVAYNFSVAPSGEAPYKDYTFDLSNDRLINPVEAEPITDGEEDGPLLVAPQTLNYWAPLTSTAEADAAHQSYLEIECAIATYTNYVQDLQNSRVENLKNIVGEVRFGRNIGIVTSPFPGFSATSYQKIYLDLHSFILKPGKCYTLLITFDGAGRDENGTQYVAPAKCNIIPEDGSEE